MKTIIKSLFVVVAVAAVAGGATYAYFTSATTSSGNLFSAGTLNLKLGSESQDYASTGIVFGTATNMAPGGPEVGPYNLYFKNTGNIAGNVKVNMSYDNKGDGSNAWDKVAEKMVIKSASLDGTYINRQAYWAAQIMQTLNLTEASAINNGYIVRLDNGTILVDGNILPNLAPTVFGLSYITLYFNDPANPSNDMSWAPTDIHKESVSLILDKTADNSVQGAGINISVTATMKQVTDTSNPLAW